jgi:orotate phosphoribosyltransferase
MGVEWRRLLEILYQTSFRVSDSEEYRLSSGRFSRYYVDCKCALSYPEARDLLGKLICDRLDGEQFDAVGGLEIGAYPIATAVSDRVYRDTGATLRAFIVRKEPKSHGIPDLVAGHVKSGDRTLIVDDVLTTGKSTIDAITRAREAGLQVTTAILMVDREEDNGKQNIEKQHVRYSSLFTLSDLIRRANDGARTYQTSDSAGSLQKKSA